MFKNNLYFTKNQIFKEPNLTLFKVIKGYLLSKSKKKESKGNIEFFIRILKINLYSSNSEIVKTKKKILLVNFKMNKKQLKTKINFMISDIQYANIFTYINNFFKNKNVDISFFPTKTLTFINHKKTKLNGIKFFLTKGKKNQILKFVKTLYFLKKNPKKNIFNLFKYELIQRNNSFVEQSLAELTLKYFSKK